MGRALVTGGSGLIGSHLVEHLLSEGDEVRVLLRDASRPGWLSSTRVDIDVVAGDITDLTALERAVQGTDVVYHVAGQTLSFSEEGFNQVNQTGAATVAAACAGRTTPPVMVAVSSLAAAGPSSPGRPRVEAARPGPITAYGRSKLRGEETLRKYASQVPLTIIRPPTVFGPRERYLLRMFKLVSRGWHVTVGTGALELSLVEVRDLAAGLRLAAARGRRLAEAPEEPSTGVYFLAQPEHHTLDALAALMATALDRPAPRPVRVPLFVAWGVAAVAEAAARIRRQPGFVSFDKVREASAGSWACSPARAEHELGFRPRPDLAEGLRHTAAWYWEKGWLNQRLADLP